MPLSHAEQLDGFRKLLLVPGSQSMHVSLVALYRWPNAHVAMTTGGTAQVVLPLVTTAPLLASHCRHVDWPASGWYWPFGHAVHVACPTSEKVPGAQFAHWVLLLYLPAEH